MNETEELEWWLAGIVWVKGKQKKGELVVHSVDKELAHLLVKDNRGTIYVKRSEKVDVMLYPETLAENLTITGITPTTELETAQLLDTLEKKAAFLRGIIEASGFMSWWDGAGTREPRPRIQFSVGDQQQLASIARILGEVTATVVNVPTSATTASNTVLNIVGALAHKSLEALYKNSDVRTRRSSRYDLWEQMHRSYSQSTQKTKEKLKKGACTCCCTCGYFAPGTRLDRVEHD